MPTSIRKNTSEYDGIYFVPGDEEKDLLISYWNFKDESMSNAQPIDNTKIGNMYHVAFFRRDENGEPAFDGAFEAIFADPAIYVSNLVGANVYGCMVKKTEKSSDWFDDYLRRTMGHVKIRELIQNLKSILETK
jgi:hypothetical protein